MVGKGTNVQARKPLQSWQVPVISHVTVPLLSLNAFICRRDTIILIFKNCTRLWQRQMGIYMIKSGISLGIEAAFDSKEFILLILFKN